MKGLRRKTSKNIRLSLIATFFVVLTIPFVLYGVLETENLDTSSGASEGEPEVTACTIDFLYVNPETIEVGTTVQLETRAKTLTKDEFIKSLKIVSSDGELLVREYPKDTESLTETFNFTAQLEGNNQLLGTLTTNLDVYPCIVQDVDSNEVLAKAINNPPRFTTSPGISAKPSNFINIEDSYTYNLRAEDIDKDSIEYSYSLSPKAKWLSVKSIKDGSNGELELEFKGNADQTGSYLANVFIHDGYNRHISSQSWVISVEPAENDIPSVRVNQPKGSIAVTQGEKVTVAWAAEDQNQIVKYRLYYAQNPGNSNSWKLINDKISYKDNQYSVDTSKIKAGTYKFIVEAEDNQDPAAVGKGVSGEVIIKAKGSNTTKTEPTPPTEEPDDGPILQDPQVVNINPSDGSDISNNRKTLSATLIAGTDAEIIKESIQMSLDDNDVTSDLEISEISKSEMTIIFKPTEDLQAGEHKIEVSFNDTKEGTAKRAWTFTISGGTSSENPDSISIFGYMVPKRIAIIVGIGLGVLVLALIIPWLLYLAWRNTGDDDQMEKMMPKPPNSGPNNAGFSRPSSSNTYYQSNPNLLNQTLATEAKKKSNPDPQPETQAAPNQPKGENKEAQATPPSGQQIQNTEPSIARPIKPEIPSQKEQITDTHFIPAEEISQPQKPVLDRLMPMEIESEPSQPSEQIVEGKAASAQDIALPDTMTQTVQPKSPVSQVSSISEPQISVTQPAAATSAPPLTTTATTAAPQNPTTFSQTEIVADQSLLNKQQTDSDAIVPNESRQSFENVSSSMNQPIQQISHARPQPTPDQQTDLPASTQVSPDIESVSPGTPMQTVQQNIDSIKSVKPPLVENVSTETSQNSTPLPAPEQSNFTPIPDQQMQQPQIPEGVNNQPHQNYTITSDAAQHNSQQAAETEEIQALAKELEELKKQNGESRFPAYLQNGNQSPEADINADQPQEDVSSRSGVTFAAPPPQQE
ncbi:hypothetical protein KC622_01740 [Candidatus Dojkabacteria bacterium]|uniref:Fibronectin type-III domain-containing protein n=1 Tax=Candidatus Dojkabacteria bacterium TaxID=2099670 RepID=A0A955KVE5_9BACT|nr:hypothetical protein [Candidatus Dojkabacteria bacterium]MCB9790842.1 hypothetical protein [Candidatus Nomurabacteria bacterium]